MESSFSPQEAARELRVLSSFEGALRQRAEGVLWMVMGLVAASLFLAYSLLGAMGGLGPIAYAIVWIPLVGSGAAIVWGIRRSLALDADRRLPPEAWLILGLGAAMLPVTLVALGNRDAASSLALLSMSVVAALPALLPSLGFTRAGRRVSLVLAGWGVFAGATLLAFQAPIYVGAWVGGTTMFGWIAAGLWETLQG